MLPHPFLKEEGIWIRKSISSCVCTYQAYDGPTWVMVDGVGEDQQKVSFHTSEEIEENVILRLRNIPLCRNQKGARMFENNKKSSLCTEAGWLSYRWDLQTLVFSHMNLYSTGGRSPRYGYRHNVFFLFANALDGPSSSTWHLFILDMVFLNISKIARDMLFVVKSRIVGNLSSICSSALEINSNRQQSSKVGPSVFTFGFNLLSFPFSPGFPEGGSFRLVHLAQNLSASLPVIRFSAENSPL